MKKPSENVSITVLVIEDKPTWTYLIYSEIPKHIYVDCSMSLRDALQKDLSKYQLIILDLILPDSPDPIETFLTLFRDVKIHRQLIIPIIIISGQDDDQISKDILDYGVTAYIDKSEWNPQKFRQLIGEAIHESSTQRYHRQYRSLISILNGLPLSDLMGLTHYFHVM